MMVRLSKTFHFEAAHDLPTFPPDHKCRRLHGHSFRFDVVVQGEVDPAKGYLIDYGDIKKAAEPLVKRLEPQDSAAALERDHRVRDLHFALRIPGLLTRLSLPSYRVTDFP
jgi:6-pyruvoyl tetrahydropterin synthase/QueD family protein